MKTIVELTREAGGFEPTPEFLERLVELVRADEREQGQKWFDAVTAQHRVMILAEREACAKVADYYATGMERNYSEIIADAIRARGETNE
jgi:hypothetical protein